MTSTDHFSLAFIEQISAQNSFQSQAFKANPRCQTLALHSYFFSPTRYRGDLLFDVTEPHVGVRLVVHDGLVAGKPIQMLSTRLLMTSGWEVVTSAI